MKNEPSISSLQAPCYCCIPKCSGFEAVGAELRSAAVPSSLGSGGGGWHLDCAHRGAAGAEEAEGIRLVVLSVTQFIARRSLIKMSTVVEEADPVHPSSCDPHWRWYTSRVNPPFFPPTEA